MSSCPSCIWGKNKKTKLNKHLYLPGFFQGSFPTFFFFFDSAEYSCHTATLDNEAEEEVLLRGGDLYLLLGNKAASMLKLSSSSE